jgi:large subunit ribosomal protein L24
MKKIKIGDKVKVILGFNKGQLGQVKSLKAKKNKVVIEGINKKIKHVKPIRNVKVGKIINFDAPIDISNIMLCDENGVKCKVEFIFENGIKIRVLKS